MPSGARPPSRKARAKATTSLAVALSSPLGPRDRGMPHWGVTLSEPGAPRWPQAALKRSTSSGRLHVRSSPRGASTSSRTTVSHTRPVTTSSTRPAMLNPALQ